MRQIKFRRGEVPDLLFMYCHMLYDESKTFLKFKGVDVSKLNYEPKELNRLFWNFLQKIDANFEIIGLPNSMVYIPNVIEKYDTLPSIVS